ncbi:putative HTH-type transcriptional regulator YtcD [Chryseobacterium potabilaquae]|uniref:Putative HTH-type transcriptional regulator YtcD n=1 Tax=Chryseobacterium potabilaquae TaxID=2675057 RepID=A0A6N4XC96_9FLAO|nr:putative HTH-type transcriptional regulator YtcD [Chryseobacterium potabilaquae]
MYTIDNKDYPCCTSITMKFIGGKWKAVILFYLIDGAKRYSELKKLLKEH